MGLLDKHRTDAIVHPNDHVNCGQSTNDVIPTAGKMTSLKLLKNARKELERLYQALCEKADEFDEIIKMGRTQMQDACPYQAWAGIPCVFGSDTAGLEPDRAGAGGNACLEHGRDGDRNRN